MRIIHFLMLTKYIKFTRCAFGYRARRTSPGEQGSGRGDSGKIPMQSQVMHHLLVTNSDFTQISKIEFFYQLSKNQQTTMSSFFKKKATRTTDNVPLMYLLVTFCLFDSLPKSPKSLLQKRQNQNKQNETSCWKTKTAKMSNQSI